MTAIGEARKELQNGNIIIYPTDTVWGMGCDPFNQKAIDQLFNIKGKKIEGLSVMFDNIDGSASSILFKTSEYLNMPVKSSNDSVL